LGGVVRERMQEMRAGLRRMGSIPKNDGDIKQNGRIR
jgi:hypothetical protein